MIAYDDTRPHPLGLIDNPEWRATEARRADLYLEERARRNADREPSKSGVVVAIFAIVIVAACLIGAVL